jgi:dTDP-4-amino-4,6-dideoxygalactose transaminase
MSHNQEPFIDFSPPSIGDEEIDEVVKTLRSDWITTADKTRQFKEAFARYIGAEKALAVSSATDAMLVGLSALAHRGRMVGTMGALTAFSFYATKNMTTAEGSWYYEVILPGYKCNMTDIQSSIGLHQLKKLPGFQKRRREVVRAYTEGFQNMPELELPVALESFKRIVSIPLHPRLSDGAVERVIKAVKGILREGVKA